MSSRNEDRRIIELTRELSRAPIDQRAADRAVAAVRAQLAPRRRWVFPAAAAAIVAIALLIFAQPYQSRATAAEQLQRAAAATRDYKGWVHIRTDPPPAPTSHARSTLHMNTIDGTSVREVEADGRREIEMHIPAKKLWYKYNPHSNELRIAEITAMQADTFAYIVATTPVSADELLRMYSDKMGKPPLTTKATEGDLTRYDIAIANTQQKLVVLVDPKTNLIREIRGEGAQTGPAAKFSYGPPEFRDIHDAGVPRDAIVIDGRPAPDAREVVERLHRRVLDGFGDHVAILTEEQFFAGTKRAHEVAEFRIFARDGNDAISYRFFSMNDSKERWLVDRPANWPTPSLDDVLAVVKDGWPAEVHVTRGEESWQAGMSGGKFKSQGRMGLAEQNRYLYSAAAMIWPPHEWLGANIPGAKARLLNDPARPGLIGVTMSMDADSTPGQRITIPAVKRIYWIDPKNDDMPAEILDGEPAADGELRNYLHTRFKTYVQSFDRKWYPTSWEINCIKDKAKSNIPTRVIHLQIFPGMKIDRGWYDDPAKRFGS